MRYLAVLMLSMMVAGCSSPVGTNTDRAGATSDGGAPAVATVPGGPPPIHTWFDPQAAQRIMSVRADFDAAEAEALAELDRTIGAYRDVMMVTREQYRRQLASAPEPIARSDAWRREQQKRAAHGYSIVQPKIDAASQRLTRETLATLASFFRRELSAGRISRTDYERYTVEIGRGYFPGFRGRKWSGPAVYEFRGADVSPEYQKVLQEVRRLWQAQGHRRSVVVSTATEPAFYRTMVARR